MDNVMVPGDFRIGDPVIDAEHAIIMGIIDQIHNGVAENCDPKAISTLLTHLFDYSAMHFLREELLMEKINAPLRKEHFNNHIKLMEDLKAARKMYETGEAVGGSVADNISQLFANHILTVDIYLKAYIDALGSTERYM